jgi:hypothetical protein
MPQPVDPTTEIGRMAAIERVQQWASRADLAAQARQAAEAAKHQMDAESHVDQTQAKSDEVDRETKRRNPYSGRRRHKREEDAPPTPESRTFYTADEHTTVVEDDEQHRLDITI